MFIRDIVHTRLTKAGYAVTTVSAGDAVFDALEEELPDLLLLDLDLPGMHGFDVLERIRKTDNLKDLSVVVFTNEMGDEILERTKSLRAEYIFKASAGTGELEAFLEKKFAA